MNEKRAWDGAKMIVALAISFMAFQARHTLEIMENRIAAIENILMERGRR